MNWRSIKAIIRKDLKVVLQSKAVLMPLIIVPVLLLFVMPLSVGMMLANIDAESEVVTDFQRELTMFFDNLPDTIQEKLNQYDNDVQRMTYIIFNLFFPAMYLLLPTMVANVMAADSFAGEKERKTLEALLHAPVNDYELYVAKLLSPWLTATLIGLLSYVMFAIVITLTTLSFMGEIFIVDATWLLMIFFVTPAAAGLGLGVMVLISSRVNSFQEAYQLGGLVAIPIVLLLLSQVAGIVYFSPLIIVGVGSLLWLVTLILMGYGAQTFERDRLITNL